MLLPEDIRPEDSLYYNGGKIIEALQDSDSIGLLDLFERVNKIKVMSFSVFLLGLDWLYLIDAAIMNKEGNVELCL